MESDAMAESNSYYGVSAYAADLPRNLRSAEAVASHRPDPIDILRCPAHGYAPGN